MILRLILASSYPVASAANEYNDAESEKLKITRIGKRKACGSFMDGVLNIEDGDDDDTDGRIDRLEEVSELIVPGFAVKASAAATID